MARHGKFVCQSCQEDRGKGIWYRRVNTDDVDSVQDAHCPIHGDTMECLQIQKSTPKYGKDLNSASAARPSRKRKSPAVSEVVRAREEKIVAFLKSEGALTDEMLKQEAEEEARAAEIAEKADRWLPKANFNPAMRLTAKDGARRSKATPEQLKLVQEKFFKMTPTWCQIGAPNNRLDENSTGQEMKKNALGCNETSAQKHAGRGMSYKVNKQKSLEWCHMLGDCLGGLTKVNNLVAASFCANTEMLAIEHCIKGYAALGVTVSAFCSNWHVAELIVYELKHLKSGKTFRWDINARNDAFTTDDWDEVRLAVLDFMTTCGIKVRKPKKKLKVSAK